MDFFSVCTFVKGLSSFIKDIFPFINLVALYVIARFITKNANLDIKKRELMFSVAKDFEGRMESLFENLKLILHEGSLNNLKARKIQIDLKVLNNLFSILLIHLKDSVSEPIYKDTQENYSGLRDLIADIELFYKDNPGTVEKDLINNYSKFIGSFIKLKFDLLKE